MLGQTLWRSFGLARLALIAIVLAASSNAGAQETVLYNFGNGIGPAEPMSNLIFDAAGNLYGTTAQSIGNADGSVFELSPEAGGAWKETLLHNFGQEGGGGYYLQGGLIFDSAGNLYGTAQYGGTHAGGVVFELFAAAGGGWEEKVLHSFGNGTEGSHPSCTLVMDTAGDLYGTTNLGGIYNQGIAFELSPTGSGDWKEKVLHNFGASATDGTQPWAGLIFDAAGNLYGTTLNGGAYKGGTVFELTPHTDGGWSERILHNFGKVDSSGVSADEVYAGVIFDAAGNLYGTTYSGGAHDDGVVFRLTPTAGGTWKTSILTSLDDTDGANPFGGLVLDAAGSLYGTGSGGVSNEDGTVFELSPSAGGVWSVTVLVAFDSTNGRNPYGSLILDSSGNLYGTTSLGGSGGLGTVFEIAH
jgi:uncharacterized repeat protein (TIGR03803 family)